MIRRLLTILILNFTGVVLISAAQTNTHIVVISHRANHENAQENSLEAIRAAIAVGADFVELDIRRTKEGRHILMHDKSVKRMTGQPGDVKDLSFEQIRSLTLAEASRPAIPPSKVPTFEEALDAMGSSIGLYLDFKDGDPEFLATELRKRNLTKKTYVYLDVSQIPAWRKADAEVRFITSAPDEAMKPAKIADYIRKYPGVVLDGSFEEYSAELIWLAHGQGALVWPDIQGRDESPSKWAKAIEMGVDGLQTDHSSKLIEYLKSIGRK